VTHLIIDYLTDVKIIKFNKKKREKKIERKEEKKKHNKEINKL